LQDEPFVQIDIPRELSSLIHLFQDKIYTLEIEMDIKDVGISKSEKNSLQKAFFNLIKNSIEAIQGTGKIRIEHYHQVEWIHIKLSDTGVGIPPDKLKTLGIPFYSTKADGTGLGLTRVYTTIHEHGGIIEVDSDLGEGTKFHIHIQLPFQSSEPLNKGK
jgi:two-component system sporulation sensor kinase A